MENSIDSLTQLLILNFPVSLSNAGGGIGPHTDDYDVFLIQMAGSRKWEVGKRFISPKEELKNLHDDLDVRILNFWDDEVDKGLVDSFILEPGDVMYLPPRVAHCGTAMSDGCMTLSVGLRAPSVKEMMMKLTEDIENSMKADFVKRYTDVELFNSTEFLSDEGYFMNDESLVKGNLHEISKDIKAKARRLIRDAFVNLLDDDSFFDEFFGKLVTETKRIRTNYPLPLDELCYDELETLGPLGDPKSCVKIMLEGGATLFAAEGITWSYSVTTGVDSKKDIKKFCRLFVDGEMFQIDISGENNNEQSRIIDLIQIIVSENQLEREILEYGDEIVPQKIVLLLCDLVAKGYLYGSEIN